MHVARAVDPLSGCVSRGTLLNFLDMIAPEEAEPGAPARSAGAMSEIEIGAPVPADGVDMWRLAVESQVLDANSRYAYVLWCRDFARTSVVARRDGHAVGYVTGYMRPEAPTTVVVWQVCVDAAAQGEGLAGRMLDAVYDAAPGADRMETTITPDNDSSIRLFTSFANRHDVNIERSALFGQELLGDGHEPEDLYRIGPTTRGETTS